MYRLAVQLGRARNSTCKSGVMQPFTSRAMLTVIYLYDHLPRSDNTGSCFYWRRERRALRQTARQSDKVNRDSRAGETSGGSSRQRKKSGTHLCLHSLLKCLYLVESASPSFLGLHHSLCRFARLPFSVSLLILAICDCTHH